MNIPSELRLLPSGDYERRSSDDKDHQAASLEQQQNSNRKLHEENLTKATKIYSESGSAKRPGREQFNKMLDDVENGLISVIYTWDLSRLSRNPIDSGRMSWLLQKGILKAIITPFRIYLSEDNVLLMNIEFGQANQFIRDLSKNIRRGIYSKAENGWKPGVAVEGYLNESGHGKGKSIIVQDPQRFDHVRIMWDLLLTGTHTVPEILEIMDKDYTYRTKKGTKLSRSGLYGLFTNTFYYGEYEYSGKWYIGKHKPMITREEFDKAQAILGRRGKQRPKTKEFAFTGTIRCGECGARITAEEKINRFGSRYIYYHCTKRINPKCSQKCIEVTKLENQIKDLLLNIEIPQEFMEWAIEEVNRLHDKESQDQTTINKNIDDAYNDCMKRINNLVKLKISPMNSDGSLLTDEVFEKQMKPLQEEKRSLEDKKKNLGERMNRWVKMAQDSFKFACTARSAFDDAPLPKKREMLVSLGSNFLLKDKTLLLDLLKPFQYIKEAKKEVDEITNRFEPQEGFDRKVQIDALYASSPVVSRGRDSNPRRQKPADLQSAPVGHLGTSGNKIFRIYYSIFFAIINT